MPDNSTLAPAASYAGTLPILADLRESRLSPTHAGDIYLLDGMLADVLREQEGNAAKQK